MSTLAVKKVMVENAIEEIALLKKGEIDAANKLLQARITCMDKLWVVETYGNDPQYQEMVNYLWEEVKELTLLLTDATDKDGILCLGSPPVIDDESEIICPGEKPILKYNLNLDVEYIGPQAPFYGLSGSFDLDGTTIALDDFTWQLNKTYPLEVASYELDFANTEYKENGATVDSNMFYKFAEGDAWIASPTKTVPVDIVDQAVNVFVKFEKVPEPTEYNVDVSLSYVEGPGGVGADDGLSGSFNINAFTQAINNFTKNDLFGYNLGIDTHTLDFNNTTYNVDGLPTDYLIQYRTSLSDPWMDAPTGTFTFDVVDKNVTVYVQFLYVAPTSFNLTTSIEWNYALGATNGFDGTWDVSGIVKSVVKYQTDPLTSVDLLPNGSHDIDLTNLLCLVDDSSEPFTVDYRADESDPWLPLAGKGISVTISGTERNVFLRCTPNPTPTEYNLNLNLQYIGGTDANDGLDGSYLVDTSTISIPSIQKSVNNIHSLSIAAHSLDFTNINYNEDGTPVNWDAQYSTDGGSTWTPVSGNVINFSIVDQDITMQVQFTKQPLPALNMNFDVIYNGDSGAGNGLTGSFEILNYNTVPISPDYTELFETTEGPLAATFWTIDVSGLNFNVGTSIVPSTVEYQVDGGGWNPVTGDQFLVEQTGIAERDVEIRLTQIATTFEIGLDVTFEGPTGTLDGLTGGYEIDATPFSVPFDYVKYFFESHGPYTNGSYSVSFASMVYNLAAVSQTYELQYRFDPFGAWIDSDPGKTVPVTIANANVIVYIRAYIPEP